MTDTITLVALLLLGPHTTVAVVDALLVEFLEPTGQNLSFNRSNPIINVTWAYSGTGIIYDFALGLEDHTLLNSVVAAYDFQGRTAGPLFFTFALVHLADERSTTSATPYFLWDLSIDQCALSPESLTLCNLNSASGDGHSFRFFIIIHPANSDEVEFFSTSFTYTNSSDSSHTSITTISTASSTSLSTTLSSSSAISSTSSSVALQSETGTSASGSSSLSTGAKAGIGVGASLVGLLALAALGIYIYRRRKQAALIDWREGGEPEKEEGPSGPRVSELPTNANIAEMESPVVARDHAVGGRDSAREPVCEME